MKKMTYTEAIDYVLGMVDNEEVKERLEALKETLAKRKSNSKPTKTQKENEAILDVIREGLATIGEKVTITELIANTEGLKGYTCQKISALMRKLLPETGTGEVEKVIEGKKTYFQLV